MIRIAYILRETGRNFIRHAGTALTSILSLTLLFLLFDLFWISAGTADRFYLDLLSELKVEAFVSETYSDSAITEISERFIELEAVHDFEYISREQAKLRLAEMIGTDLLVGYEDSNPLPRSYLLTLNEEYLNAAALTALEKELLGIDGLSEVHYSRNWLDKAERAKAIILQVGLLLGLLIFGAALLSSANNIRLMTQARAVGFRQMLLQGAGRFLIAFPFVLESLIISSLSAALGWGLIMYGRTRIGFSQIEIIYPSNEQIIFFCAAVAVLGAISGYLGLRKQLKG